MKLELASPDLGSFLSLRDAAHGRRDGRVHGHEASDARVPEAGHVERAPAVEAVPSEPGGSVHGERANFTRLVLGCVEAKFCK